MITATKYKEITCDLCGKKVKFDISYDFPYAYGFHMIKLQHTTEIDDVYEVCSDCEDKIFEYIQSIKKDKK